MRRFASIMCLTALTASCSSAPSNGLAANAVDPAIAASLADPLMTDPHLDRRSNTDVLRPADQPMQALVPIGEPDPFRPGAAPTAVARARQAIGALKGDFFADCDLAARYGFDWADRLSDAQRLPDTARVSEAAGSERGGCRLRLVSFASLQPPEAIVDHYRRAAIADGFIEARSMRDQAIILHAVRSRDGAAFVVTIWPDAAKGSLVDFVANRGR